jgi:hypothetical protein
MIAFSTGLFAQRRVHGSTLANAIIVGLTTVMVCAYSSDSRAQGSEERPFADPSTLNSQIPTPPSIIGHEVGEKAVRYDRLMRYLEALTESSNRIVMKPYGETHEGRTMVHLYVTSPENHQRLDEIKAGNGKLADPRKLPNAAAGRKLIENHPATALMAYGIHGDEISSTDAAMQLLYQLAASNDEEIISLLDDVVTIVDPIQNPDGRERHLASIEQLTGVVSSTDGQHLQHNPMAGRTNHYRFDMNRDWISLVTVENQARMKVVTAWNAQFMVDSHEMGPLEGYLMDPPRQPLSPLLPEKNLYWREQYGFDQAAAFDEFGWSYYAKDWNVEFAPVYTASWTNLAGGAGLLYEQAGVTSAAYKLETGHVLTYREAVHHHLVSSLSNLMTLKKNRRQVLGDYFDDHLAAVNGKGDLKGTFLMPPHPDRTRMARFVDLLGRLSIEYSFAEKPVNISNATDIWGDKTGRLELPAGTLVVKSNQPFRRVAHAALWFDVLPDRDYLKIEREELENHGSSRFYDVTAWNLPMSFGLTSYWINNTPNVKLSPDTPNVEREAVDFAAKPKYGYILSFETAAVYDVMVRLFEEGCHLRVSYEPFEFDGKHYKQGTIVLRGHENPDNIGSTLEALAKEFDIDVRPANSASVGKVGPDLGGPKFTLLHAPRIALLSGDMTQSAGAVWHLLDYRLEMPMSPLRSIYDLRKYNVLIAPGGNLPQSVHDWVEDGGTLIAFNRAAHALVREDSELSSVRRRRDVLDKLAMYQEDLEREQRADNIKIDFDDLFGTGQSGDTNKKDKADSKSKKAGLSGDLETLKRIDEWQRIFSPSGVFVKAKVDPRHWLGFGLGDYLPVMVGNDTALMSMHPVETPVRLVDEDDLRLSGLMWPEGRKRLANSAFATVERRGHGQVILFASDPTRRGWYPGMERLFLNAVFLGPGMGTRQQMPW